MTITFKKAPLVELIAELRWGDTAPVQQTAPLLMHGMGPDLDQFFMSFGGEVYQHGFQRAERLVPPGFPVFPFQPVFRYRKNSSADNSVLFQVGSGLFSANAVPPYRSWTTVRDTVRTGVDSLIKIRLPSERDRPFSVLSLRYINAFGPDLTKGHDIAGFISNVLGFGLSFPSGILTKIKKDSSIRPQIQFTASLEDGSSITFLVGEGAVNNEPRVIMDVTVTNTQLISPVLDTVMAAFTNARNIIHHIFIELTRPIQDLLEPVGGDHVA